MQRSAFSLGEAQELKRSGNRVVGAATGLIAGLLGHEPEVLGRWADVMVNSGTYAEIVHRHVELYSRLAMTNN